MRILHVVDKMAMREGGVAVAVRTIVAGLNELDIQSDIVSMDDKSEDFRSEESRIIPFGPGRTAWGYNPDLLKWLDKSIPEFDIIIVHGLWKYHSFATYKAIKNARKNSTRFPKLFVMPHGMLDPYFQKSPERRLKAIRNWFFWKAVENKVINGAEKLFFTTEEELRLAETTFTPYSPKQTMVTGLGVSSPPAFEGIMTEKFYEKCPGVKGKGYLLFLGRIHPKKGIDILLKAYNTVIQKNAANANSDVDQSTYTVPHLVIAGPGWDGDYGISLKQYINENFIIKDKIHLVGMIEGPAKWGAFYNADAYVLTSHQENFGISVVEALACGKPVIITKQINIWQEIIENDGGFAGNSTYEDTVTSLHRWIQLDKKTKVLMSTNAKNIFDKFFSDKTVGLRFSKAIY